jgi:hypothetical protein
MRRLIAILALLLITPLWGGRSFNGSTDLITANGIGTALDISTGPEVLSFWWKPATITTHVAVAHFDFSKSGSQIVAGLGVGQGATTAMGWQVGCCGAFGPSFGTCAATITAGLWYEITVWLDTVGTITGSPASGIFVYQAGTQVCNSHTAYTTTRTAGQSNFTIGGASGTPFAADGIIAEFADRNVLLTLQEMAALGTVFARTRS